MSDRPVAGNRVVVARDALAASLPNPHRDYTGETATVLIVRPGKILDRVMVELDHEGIPMWFGHDELEVLP